MKLLLFCYTAVLKHRGRSDKTPVLVYLAFNCYDKANNSFGLGPQLSKLVTP